VLLAALALMTLGDQGAQWFGLARDGRASAPARPEEPLPLPTASELSLSRARTLHARGHLREALTVLDAIGHGDRLQEQADELRARIQQDLLAAARASRRTASQPEPVQEPQ
jgi:hypothetical protein